MLLISSSRSYWGGKGKRTEGGTKKLFPETFTWLLHEAGAGRNYFLACAHKFVIHKLICAPNNPFNLK